MALALSMVGAASADARGLKTGFLDDVFTSSNPSVRDAWLNRATSAGAGIIRINLFWRGVATSKPAAPTNPADPAYDFLAIDDAVKDARAHGFDVMLDVISAPDWAEGPHRPSRVTPGTWKPDPGALGRFAQAVATRYSGKFHRLPRVRYFEAWNEPNLSVDLTPQWVGKKAKSPQLYRRMLNAFYGGVKAAQPDATVIGGATAPFGDPRTKPRDPRLPRMRPLAFLRKLFCLKRTLKATKCHHKPHLDVLSHHPINFLNPPHYKAVNADDVEVADFHKVRRLLHAAERAKHVRPRGHHPLWATEMGWFTKPPSSFGVPVRRHARWLEEALYMLWKQGASVAVNYEIRDQKHNRRLSHSSGIFFHDGKKKPAYRSFQFPFVTHRRSKVKVGAWGKAPRSGKLKVQTKRRKGWRTVKTVRVRRGKLFSPSFRLRGKARLRAKVGKSRSLVWRQG